MSHRFKPLWTPETAHEQVAIRMDTAKVRQAIQESETPEESEAKLMAGLIHNDEELEQLLQGADPAMRAAMLEMIRPYLSFTPADVESRPD